MKHTITQIVKGQATFNHFKDGILTYSVCVFDKDDFTRYEFDIDANNKDDVGTGEFKLQEKGLFLMRWIKRAIENNTIKIRTYGYNE